MRLPGARRACSFTAVACAVIHAGAAVASTVRYEYVQVGYVFGFGTALSGQEDFAPTTSNLPVTFTRGASEYASGSAANPGSLASGSWSLSNGVDGFDGTFRLVSAQAGFAGTPFTRYLGQRTITGGDGYFQGATGVGSVELYRYDFDTGSPDVVAYQGLEITRMSVNVETDAPRRQDDLRGVSVLVENGTANAISRSGSSFGQYTSASPSLMPVPATHSSSYTHGDGMPPFPFAGTFLDASADGLSTISGTTHGDVLDYNHLGSLFVFAGGQATATGATGVFADRLSALVGVESYAVATSASTYSAIVVDRITPVPEPKSYALLMAGLAMLGVLKGRRTR